MENTNIEKKEPSKIKTQNIIISEHLREMRIDMKMSQAEFAKEFDIPVQTYSQWESGRRNPPEYIINMIDKIFAQKKEIKYLREKENNNKTRLAKHFRKDFAAVGCPIPILNLVRIVRSTNERGEEKYHITAGDIPEKYVHAALYWLNSETDDEYIDTFAEEIEKCECDEDLEKLYHKMMPAQKEKWFKNYNTMIEEITNRTRTIE